LKKIFYHKEILTNHNTPFIAFFCQTGYKKNQTPASFTRVIG